MRGGKAEIISMFPFMIMMEEIVLFALIIYIHGKSSY